MEPTNFNCLLHGNYHYHEMVSWGDFNGFYFVVNGAPRLRGASWTYPTTLMVQLMVEKSTFIAPPAADVARRAIPALARYREPSHSRSIFEIVVTLVPFVALWALAWAAVHVGYWELSFC